MSIAVGAAGKVGDGVNAHYVFKVTSETFSIEPIQVDRRYSDFLWLHTQLARQCAGFIIPPLPAKVVPLLQGPEFLERRRAGLEKFLRKVVEHDELKNTNAFKSFLECSPVELTAIKTEAHKHEQSSGTGSGTGTGLSHNMAQKSQQLNSWWGKAYQRMAENDKVKLLAAKAGRELRTNSIEDPEFDGLVKYVTELHALVKNMQSRAQHAHKQNKFAAGAYCELIESMSAIADIEQSTPSGASASAPSDFGAVLTLLDTRARMIDAELAEFAESIDYFARWVGAVVNAVNVREDRRFVYQAKLAAKQQTSGTSPNNNTNNVSDEVLEAKEDFERVHARVVNEVQRFQVEKSAELRRLFAQYARVQAETHAELTNVLDVTTKALDGPVNTHQFGAAMPPATRQFFSPSVDTTSNQHEHDDLDDGLRKMDVNYHQFADPKKTTHPTPGNETADVYSDVRL